MEKKFYIYIKDEEHTINPYKQEDIIDIDFWEARDFVRLCVLDDFYQSINRFKPTEEQKNQFKRELSSGAYDELAMDYIFSYAIKNDDAFIGYIQKYFERDLRYGYQIDCDFDDFSIHIENDEYNLYLDANGVIIRQGDTVKWNKVKKPIYADILGGDYANGLYIKWTNYLATPQHDEKHTTQKVSVLYCGEELEVNICTLTEWEKV